MFMSTSTAGLTAFLFTDIEGSSLRWLNHRAAMEEAVARHDEIIRAVISDHGGEIFKASGDARYDAYRKAVPRLWRLCGRTFRPPVARRSGRTASKRNPGIGASPPRSRPLQSL